MTITQRPLHAGGILWVSARSLQTRSKQGRYSCTVSEGKGVQVEKCYQKRKKRYKRILGKEEKGKGKTKHLGRKMRPSFNFFLLIQTSEKESQTAKNKKVSHPKREDKGSSFKTLVRKCMVLNVPGLHFRMRHKSRICWGPGDTEPMGFCPWEPTQRLCGMKTWCHLKIPQTPGARVCLEKEEEERTRKSWPWVSPYISFNYYFTVLYPRMQDLAKP